MTPISLQSDDSEDRLFAVLVDASGPLLVQAIADQVGGSYEITLTNLRRMQDNGSPLDLAESPAGMTAELRIG